MMLAQVSNPAPQIRAGKVRVISSTKTTRGALSAGADARRVGAAGLDDVTWNGYVAPAGTPRDALARLHADREGG